MAEKYLKCPNCGASNPEGKKFCGDCGTMIPEPPPPPPVQPVQYGPTQYVPAQYAPITQRPGWLKSNWKGLLATVVVLIVVLAVVGLVFTQPWSKIKVIVNNAYTHPIGINVYIDGKLKVAMDLNGGTTTIGVWPVKTGTHTVALDHGTWNIYRYSSGEVYYYSGSYKAPDGIMDYAYDYSVGPLFTKNVIIDIPLPS